MTNKVSVTKQLKFFCAELLDKVHHGACHKPSDLQALAEDILLMPAQIINLISIPIPVSKRSGF